MIGYPPSPAVESTKPLPPISPADKIPTNKEQELVTIQTLNKRLKAALDRDKNENIELEQKRLAAKDVLSKERQELDRITWSYTQSSQDLLVHKNTWASTESDLFTKELHNNDTRKYVEHLNGAKDAFIKALQARTAQKETELASLEEDLQVTDRLLIKRTEEIEELTVGMQTESDALKQKMVASTVLENEIREANHLHGVESYHEKRWLDKCDPYGDLDPATYASNKEARSIRVREKELETRFQKIYDDTVDQMIEQHQLSRDSLREQQKKSAAEKQAIEAQMKEWQNKRLQHYNEIAKLERELAKAQQEVKGTAESLLKAESETPAKEKILSDVSDQIGVLKAELKNLSQKVEERERNCANLSAAIKAKQDAAARSKQEEESKLAELKDRLQSKKHQLEEATIGLFPEISKYRGLVDVVEVKLTPQAKRQKRATL